MVLTPAERRLPNDSCQTKAPAKRRLPNDTFIALRGLPYKVDIFQYVTIVFQKIT
jgi:hypothetical protein